MFGAPTYKEILDIHKNAYLLGLSATPYRRGTGFGLGNMFDCIVQGEQMRNLIDAGYLLPPIHYSAEGDCSEKSLRGNVLENWAKLANDRSTIIFTSTVRQSKGYVEQFQRYGISIAHIDAYTSDEDRETIYSGFNSGEIQVLTNCNVATEGSDLPIASAVVIAKNVSYLPRYLQMSGRGARIYPGQKDYLILDHSDCVKKFGLADDVYEWTLDSRVVAAKNKTNEKERKPVTCEACSHLFYYQPKCPMCMTPVVIKNQFAKTTDEDLVIVGKSKKRKVHTDELIKWFGMFFHYGKYTKKFDKPFGWAVHKWADKYKIPFDMKYKSDPIEPDEGFLNYMVHLNIRYHKFKKKQELKNAA